MEKSDFVYIYNIEQAQFYISKNIKVVDTGINKRTNRVWYKFGYYDTLQAYTEWCNRVH